MKLLTFVIPTYNSEKYLDKCISSMLSVWHQELCCNHCNHHTSDIP